MQHHSTFKAKNNQLHNQPNGLYKYSPNIKIYKITDINFVDNKVKGDQDKIELQ